MDKINIGRNARMRHEFDGDFDIEFEYSIDAVIGFIFDKIFEFKKI